MALNVRIPNGEVVTVIVPPGAEPGAYIRTPLDSAAPALTSPLGERSANGTAEVEEVSWVDASLQAEASLRWCVSTRALLLPVIYLMRLLVVAEQDELEDQRRAVGRGARHTSRCLGGE